uniref:SprT-like domain-containing protein n=1 Tax=Parastrongyloides trichosuri TaxID=131310 RepID=A0A0N4ZSE3_PARTI
MKPKNSFYTSILNEDDLTDDDTKNYINIRELDAAFIINESHNISSDAYKYFTDDSDEDFVNIKEIKEHELLDMNKFCVEDEEVFEISHAFNDDDSISFEEVWYSFNENDVTESKGCCENDENKEDYDNDENGSCKSEESDTEKEITKSIHETNNELTSSESSSSEDSYCVNKEPNFHNTIKSTNVLNKRKIIPRNIQFENINLNDSKLFLEYLNSDFYGERPKNILKYFNKRDYKKNGLELMKILFTIFNKFCFDDLLPISTQLGWNNRLRMTAGTTAYSSKRGVKIMLSDKVCNQPERIRDTLIHEMCHAASFTIDKIYKDGHGPSFKKWAKKCKYIFPNIPSISTCHDYTIEAKYHYICEGCSQTIKRHSKSLDITRKICGKCRGRFVLYVNRKKAQEINYEKEVKILSESFSNTSMEK